MTLINIQKENGYIPVRSRNIGGRMAGGWLSLSSDDLDWDNFLQTTALRHYEQSTLWALAKRCEGWWPIRIVLTLDGHIAGGVQILARHTGLDRVTGWRRVWSGTHRERHPNHALIFEVTEWAYGRGYKFFDFGGLDRDIAMALLRREPLLDGQKAGKDFVHLGYGGTPHLTPDSRVYISHPLLRFAYQTGGLGKVVKRFRRNNKNLRLEIYETALERNKPSRPKHP